MLHLVQRAFVSLLFLASSCPEDEHCQAANFTVHVPDTCNHWPIISTWEWDPSFLIENFADSN